MTPNLLDELEAYNRLCSTPGIDVSFKYQAAANFMNTHAPALADMAKRLEAAERDSKRLDALEQMANKPGGILLHDGSESGRCGIGLRPGFANRTLREAIDATQEGEG